METNYIQRHFWQKEPIQFFKALDNPAASDIILISCFNTRLVNFKCLKEDKRWVYYSGERFLSEKNADVVISFIPNTDDIISLSSNAKYFNLCVAEVNLSSGKYTYNMSATSKTLQELVLDIRDRNKIFIQLRDQEREHIEYILQNKTGKLKTSFIYDVYKYCNLYSKLNEGWINTYNKLVNNEFKKDKFCCFIVSNPNCWERNKMFDFLRIICNNEVDSFGKWKKNVNVIIPERYNREEYLKLISQYRFMITFENHSMPWYNTEKIYNALSAGTIPIYWGDPLIDEIYNTECFIHVKTFSDKQKQINEFIKVCERIKEIEDDIINNGLTNSEKYLKFYKQSYLVNNVNTMDKKLQNNLLRIYDVFNPSNLSSTNVDENITYESSENNN